MSVSEHEALANLLLELFEPDELRRLLRYGPDGEALARELPGAAAPSASTAYCAVEVLARRGLVDSDFFERLRVQRPRRAVEILAVERLWWPVEAPEGMQGAESTSQVCLHLPRHDWEAPQWSNDTLEIPFTLTNRTVHHAKLLELTLVVEERSRVDTIRLPLPGAPVSEFNLAADLRTQDSVDLLRGLRVQFVTEPRGSEAFRLRLRGPEGHRLKVRLSFAVAVLSTPEVTCRSGAQLSVLYPIRTLAVARTRAGGHQ